MIRPTQATTQAFRDVAKCYSASCVFADVQSRSYVMHSAIKPIFPGKPVGVALPVRLSAGDLPDPLAALEIAQPDDMIVADEIGVIVVPNAKLDEVLKLAREQAEREEFTRREIAKGKTVEQLLAEFGRI